MERIEFEGIYKDYCSDPSYHIVNDPGALGFKDSRFIKNIIRYSNIAREHNTNIILVNEYNKEGVWLKYQEFIYKLDEYGIIDRKSKRLFNMPLDKDYEAENERNKIYIDKTYIELEDYE